MSCFYAAITLVRDVSQRFGMVVALAVAILIPAAVAFGGDFLATPLIDNPAASYRPGSVDFRLGLYRGTNLLAQVSPPHDARARAAATQVVPRCRNGSVPRTVCDDGGTGKIVVLALGFSNWSEEMCAAPSSPSDMRRCGSGTFINLVGDGISASPPTVDSHVFVVNCARRGDATRKWAQGGRAPPWAECDELVAKLGLSANQVQVVLFKTADGFPQPNHTMARIAGPVCGAGDVPKVDACENEADNAIIARIAKARWPKLQLMFLHSRIYAGYATDALNPEPFAYEYGFAVQFTILAQINQADNGGSVDSVAGDLSYVAAPVLLWGAYFWADGDRPNANQTSWRPADFRLDGTHPGPSGIAKVATSLFNFFAGSSPEGRNASAYTAWFRPQPQANHGN